MNKLIYIIGFIFIMIVTGCEGEKVLNKAYLNDISSEVTADEIQNLSEKKIYFGHQSVGFNILQGIDELIDGNKKYKLNIIKSNNPEIFKEPVLAHFTIGENYNPELKLSDFRNSMANGIGNSADIAFMKFCYLDINKTTDINKVFNIYKETFDKLKIDYPKTKFIHITVPLTLSELTFRSIIKRILGRPDNNIMRNRFNNMIISEYGDKDLIFDLAKIESTYPDQTRSSFKYSDEVYYSLAPEYAADNGHLNEVGRKIAAVKLLKLLSDIKLDQ